VDSAACIRNGIVPKYFANKMVDSVYWTIKSNQLYKNDIMMLDIIASSAWKRPIYFAAPSSVSHCFNLDSFCLSQGWTYKFMPVKANPGDYIPGMGGVDAEGSYDILMNKCAYGNLNDPHVYVDPESLNNSVRPKTSILRVAQHFVDAGQKEKAVKIMDRYFEAFPDSKITFDMYIVPFAELYYKAGQPDKANKIITRLTEIYRQNIDFYYSFSGQYKDYFKEDIQTSLGILRRMSQVASENGQKGAASAVDSVFNMELKRFQ
jgi:hypothetical protein